MKNLFIALFSSLISGFGVAETLECEIEQVSTISADGTRQDETVFDNFEGRLFQIDTIDGSVSNFDEFSGHVWRKDVFVPDPEEPHYFLRMVSVTKPEETAIMNIIYNERIEIEEALMFWMIAANFMYSGMCLPSHNN